jgi:DNA-binding NtrC family response regulator
MMVVAVGITSEEVRSLAGKAPATRAGRIPGLLKCLVVSGDADLRRRLDTMADLAGWSACEAPVDAAELRSLVDSDYHLVIADIARPLGERVNDTVEIAEEFAGRPDTLVVVCGSGESVDEELWARQLGAWVYLPGVAQRVVERRGAFQFV